MSRSIPRGSFGFDRRTLSGGAEPATAIHSSAHSCWVWQPNAQVSVEPFATRMNNWWQAYYVQRLTGVSPRSSP